MNWQEFFEMGGYAFYVWTSYAIALVVLVANLIVPILEKGKILNEIKAKQIRLGKLS